MTRMPCLPHDERGTLRARRAVERLHAIQAAACRLVVERGYDGFTMDELAADVGVSRRTLFNYVPDKASAVVGPFDPAGAGQHVLEVFRGGGPSGNLVADLNHAVEAVTDQADELENVEAGHHQIVEAAIAADPKVLAIVTQRFEAVTHLLERTVIEREGWPDGDLRARVLAATTLALIKVTLAELGSQPDGGSAADFKAVFRRVTAVHAALNATT